MAEVEKAIDYYKGRLKAYQTALKPIPFASKRSPQEIRKILRKIKFTELAIDALQTKAGEPLA
jgi:hypothetical protein